MLGLLAIIVYSSNYIIGTVSFLFYTVFGLSNEIKAEILPYHILLGTFALFAAAFAVETGIMELTTELYIDGLPACSYSVSSPDLNPAMHYGSLAGGCKVANGIGIMVAIAVFFTFFAIFEHPKAAKDPQQMALLVDE